MLERKLLDYKKTGDEVLFGEIINSKEINVFINSVVRKNNKINFGLNQKEDLLNIAKFRVWKAIDGYKFICPHCNKKALNENAFKAHTYSKHGKHVEPKVSCLSFVKYQVGAYIQNELRKEYSMCRDTNKTARGIIDNIENTKFNDEDKNSDSASLIKGIMENSSDFTDDVIINELVIESMNLLDDMAQEILEYIMEDMTNTEIAEVLHNQGYYSTLQSARVSVKRIIDNKIKKQLNWLQCNNAIIDEIAISMIH